MNANTNLLLTASAAFAGGFVSGLLFAPQSGRQLRRLIAGGTQRRAQWLEQQVHAMEAQIDALERSIQETSHHFGARLREATDHAVQHYVPVLPEDPQAWSVKGAELTRELRRMPRS